MYKGPNRKNLRFASYNYSEPGEYFVTICTKGFKNYFGRVVNSRVELSRIGKIANECWRDIPNHFPNVKLDEYVVMPNHVHGVVVIGGFAGTADLRSLRDRTKMLLPKIIHGFKSSVTRILHKIDGEIPFAWQKSYFDHIIQTDEALDNIREYIRLNPLNWENDLENLKNLPQISEKEHRRLRKNHYKNLLRLNR